MEWRLTTKSCNAKAGLFTIVFEQVICFSSARSVPIESDTMLKFVTAIAPFWWSLITCRDDYRRARKIMKDLSYRSGTQRVIAFGCLESRNWNKTVLVMVKVDQHKYNFAQLLLSVHVQCQRTSGGTKKFLLFDTLIHKHQNSRWTTFHIASSYPEKLGARWITTFF